jgi:hypothetical protein
VKEFVKDVKPRMVVSVHTLHTEVYEKWWDKVHLLKNTGESVEIK